MKAFFDRRSVPDSHWKTWNQGIEFYEPHPYLIPNNRELTDRSRQFNFNRTHLFWEHRMASDLAKVTKANTGEIDMDGDSQLTHLITDVWLPDIQKHSPSSYMSDFHQLWTSYHPLRLDLKIPREEAWEKKDKETKLERKQLTEFVLWAIETEYELHESSMRDVLYQEVMTERIEDAKPGEDPNLRPIADYELNSTILYGSQYSHSIINYPGDNLASYLHDKVLYNEFIQMITYPLGDEKLEQIVESKALLSDDKEIVLEAAEYCMKFINYLWT